MYNYYTDDVESVEDLEINEIFVFGSNLAGIHGAGAAKIARDRLMADTGTGYGFTGFCFAIPTKDYKIKTLPLADIEENIRLFKICAALEPSQMFYVTKVGCGLASYKDYQIAPMFKGSPSNCRFHKDWKPYLE